MIDDDETARSSESHRKKVHKVPIQNMSSISLRYKTVRKLFTENICIKQALLSFIPLYCFLWIVC